MKTILFLIYTFLPLASFAGTNQIEGAFGIKLGDVFDRSKATVTNLANGLSYYGTIPKQPNEYFCDYAVAVTPKSGLVYSIVAVSRPDKDFDNLVIRRDAIAKTISDKYGKATNIHNGFGVVDGPRVITITLDAEKPTINVCYTDATLSKIAKIEQEEIEKDIHDKKIAAELNGKNNSGL